MEESRIKRHVKHNPRNNLLLVYIFRFCFAYLKNYLIFFFCLSFVSFLKMFKNFGIWKRIKNLYNLNSNMLSKKVKSAMYFLLHVCPLSIVYKNSWNAVKSPTKILET